MKTHIRNYFGAIVAFIICFGTTGCKKAKSAGPALDFTYSGALNIGSIVSFHSNAPAGSTFLWKFGDGSQSTDSVPVHSYQSSDSFTVSLMVNNNTGLSVVKRIYIGAALDFTYTGLKMAGNTLNFQSNASTSDVYLWDFGDGNTSTQIMPDHAFAVIGSNTVYTVSLTIGNDAAHSAKKAITIFKDPVYTHLIAGARLLHHYSMHYGYMHVDSTISPDTTVSIRYLDPLTITFGTDTMQVSGITDSSISFFGYNRIQPGPGGSWVLFLDYDFIMNTVHYKRQNTSITNSIFEYYDSP
jgi:hypothetical protein